MVASQTGEEGSTGGEWVKSVTVRVCGTTLSSVMFHRAVGHPNFDRKRRTVSLAYSIKAIGLAQSCARPATG